MVSTQAIPFVAISNAVGRPVDSDAYLPAVASPVISSTNAVSSNAVDVESATAFIRVLDKMKVKKGERVGDYKCTHCRKPISVIVLKMS